MPTPGKRYEFGPTLSRDFAPPAPVDPAADVEITLDVVDVRGAGPGLVDADFSIGVPPYDATMKAELLEVHLVAFPTLGAIPPDPEAAIAAAGPRGSVDASGRESGVTLLVTVPGIAAGSAAIASILAFRDYAPAAPAA